MIEMVLASLLTVQIPSPAAPRCAPAHVMQDVLASRFKEQIRWIGVVDDKLVGALYTTMDDGGSWTFLMRFADDTMCVVLFGPSSIMLK